jgi:hypothetical protein
LNFSKNKNVNFWVNGSIDRISNSKSMIIWIQTKDLGSRKFEFDLRLSNSKSDFNLFKDQDFDKGDFETILEN